MAFISRSVRKYMQTSDHHFLPAFFQKGHSISRCSSSCGNNNETIAIEFSTDPDERYNVYTYQLPLSEKQHEEVLKTLNEASIKQLTEFKLSRSAAQKLLSDRQKKGSFKHIRELLLVEGLGFKKIEAVCNTIVHFDKIQAKKKSRKEKRPQRFFVPEQSRHKKENVHSVLGVSLNGPALCWCLLQYSPMSSLMTNTESPVHSDETPSPQTTTTSSSAASVQQSVNGFWRVTNINCRVLSPFKLELPNLYDQVCSALEEIPVCDAYLFSDKAAVKAKMLVDELSASLIHEHIKGLLAVGLNSRAGREAPLSSSLRKNFSDSDEMPEEPTVVYYTKENLASKALVLKGPSQRLTGAVAARSLLSGCPPAPLPGFAVSPETVPVYNNLAINQQYGINNALISALAFTILSR